MFRKLSTAALSGSFWGTSCHKDQCRSLAHRRLRCEPLEDRRLLSVFNLPDAEYATVAAAVASATYGDTINLPADTAVWNSHLSITKGITIQGAGESSTIIISNYAPGNTSPYTATNYLIDFTPDATSLANDTPFQISGITFDLDGKCGGIMLKNTTTSPYTITTHNHIDHCTIQNATGGAAVGITVQGPLYGTIDHNTFANNSKTGLIYGLNLTSWNNPGTPYAYGTAENVIFENNAITFTTNVPPVSIGQGAKACLRNNTFTYNGIADIYGWFSIEGNMTSLHAAMGAEIYGNTLISVNNKNIRIFSHKGGKALIYNNDVITTGTVSAIATEEYTDPTTNNPQPEHVSDSYYWNNTKNGTTLVTPTITTYSGVYALQWDVDCWKQVASFNGTSGVGVGTLANRPATCTTGVGYFATDEGEHGTLFKATATNTWTAYYEPYDANPFPDDWIIAASAEYADVAAAVASATYGDTVYVPAGEATWASALVITKGITLRGASAGQTVITAGHDINNSNALSPSHYVIAYVPDAASIANDTPFRVTDFTLDMDNRCAGILIKHTTSLTPITQIQIDHCEILNCHAAQYSPRVIYAHGTIYGFIDHNTFNNNSTILISGLGQSSWDTYAPYVFGSPNNIFIEYNTFTVPNTQCLVDLQNGQGYVFRYNTANFTGTSSV